GTVGVRTPGPAPGHADHPTVVGATVAEPASKRNVDESAAQGQGGALLLDPPVESCRGNRRVENDVAGVREVEAEQVIRRRRAGDLRHDVDAVGGSVDHRGPEDSGGTDVAASPAACLGRT